jgi:phosphoribosylformylglycinamidine synthase
MKRVAVLQLPGSNCERESARACAAVGLAPEIFRWNREARELAAFDAVILPGGFAFEDRVRAGALAAKLPVIGAVADMAAAGKGVVGICNGAQILVEAGLVPGIVRGAVEMALAPNASPRGGYDCRWVRVAPHARARRSILTAALAPGEAFPIPIAHGEGRFVAADGERLLARLVESGQALLAYVDASGAPRDDIATNPNGSLGALAAISNPEGNVAAIMPHPERASWLFQIPAESEAPWGARRRAARDASALDAPGPGRRVFESIRAFLEEGA